MKKSVRSDPDALMSFSDESMTTVVAQPEVLEPLVVRQEQE
jgi:hypothetical protein